MKLFADVGGGSLVNVDKILAVEDFNGSLPPFSKVLDLTAGFKIRSAIYTTNGKVILSSKSRKEIDWRVNL